MGSWPQLWGTRTSAIKISVERVKGLLLGGLKGSIKYNKNPSNYMIRGCLKAVCDFTGHYDSQEQHQGHSIVASHKLHV